jgi:hypothetical protein
VYIHTEFTFFFQCVSLSSHVHFRVSLYLGIKSARKIWLQLYIALPWFMTTISSHMLWDYHTVKTHYHKCNCVLVIQSVGIYMISFMWNSTIRICWDRKQTVPAYCTLVFLRCISSILYILSCRKDMTSQISKDSTWSKMRFITSEQSKNTQNWIVIMNFQIILSLWELQVVCRMWVSHTNGYEEYYLLGYNTMLQLATCFHDGI